MEKVREALRAEGLLLRIVPGHRDERRIARPGARRAEQPRRVVVAQPHVRDHHVRIQMAQFRQAVARAVRDGDVGAVVLEELAQDRARLLVVFNDQDMEAGQVSGLGTHDEQSIAARNFHEGQNRAARDVP